MPLNMRDLIKKYNEAKSKMGGAGYVKLVAGENRMRLVTFPNEDGEEELYVTTRTHFIESASFPCLRVNKGDYCPVCSYASKLKEMGQTEVAGKLTARTRHLFNVLVGQEMRILECGNTIWNQIMAYFADEEYGNIADPKTGRDIKITKEGAGLNTEYSVLVAPKETSIKLPAEPKNLYALIQSVTEEELENALYSAYERLPEEETAAAPEAEADEVEEEAVAEAEEEAPKPKAGKKPNTSWADDTFGPVKKDKDPKKPTAKKPAGKPKPGGR